MAGEGLHVRLVSPERVVYEGRADSVVATAWDGEVGILKGHAPMMTLLGRGELRVREGASVRRFRVRGGVLEVVGDEVTVLSEDVAEPGAP